MRTTLLRILFPLAFLIFPVMYVIILGPAVPQILGTFGGSYVCRCRIGNLLAVVRYLLAVSGSYWRRKRMEG